MMWRTMPGDCLAIWLAPQGDSTSTGLARQESQGEDRSGITIFLAEDPAGEAAPDHASGNETTSEATPTSG